MYIERIYTSCLAQASYYIESEGIAAVIDPMRDVDPYISLAKRRNAKIKFVLNTHFHADFVSGQLDLAGKTGAVIIFGPEAHPKYSALVMDDGERIRIGDNTIEILHTPGHTIESTCFLVNNAQGLPFAVFTGDTLFVGDVGRPDLLSGNLGKETLAAMLYDSVHTKLKCLPDEVFVYPGHGIGSACGKNLGTEAYSTIGEQKKKNYALSDISKEAFVELVTSAQPSVPAYFFKDAKINSEGAPNLDEVVKYSMRGFSAYSFNQAMTRGTLVLDTRTSLDFGGSFIPGAVNIGLDGQFAHWFGSLIDFEKHVLIVSEPGKEKEVIIRLARIGFDKVMGYLEGGMAAWNAANLKTDQITTLSPADLQLICPCTSHALLDVRKKMEFNVTRLPDAINIPLEELTAALPELDKNVSYTVCCAGGYRSMIAASLLKRAGFKDVENVKGGVNLIKYLTPELLIS
jgi:hydroxyacylglutathione hydrolase